MRKRYCLVFFVALFFVLFVTFLGVSTITQLNHQQTHEVTDRLISMIEPKPLEIPLQNFSMGQYLLCKEIENGRSFTYKKIGYYVLTSWSTFYPMSGHSENDEIAFSYLGGSIYFSPAMLKSPHFQTACAHELGHIQTQDQYDEFGADSFAEKVVGKKAVLEMLFYFNKKYYGRCVACRPRIYALLFSR